VKKTTVNEIFGQRLKIAEQKELQRFYNVRRQPPYSAVAVTRSEANPIKGGRPRSNAKPG
jgi:hypothetical protein